MESRGVDHGWRLARQGWPVRQILQVFLTRVERQLTDRSAVIAQLAGKYRAQWGEGPIWWDGKLYYVIWKDAGSLSLLPDRVRREAGISERE